MRRGTTVRGVVAEVKDDLVTELKVDVAEIKVRVDLIPKDEALANTRRSRVAADGSRDLAGFGRMWPESATKSPVFSRYSLYSWMVEVARRTNPSKGSGLLRALPPFRETRRFTESVLRLCIEHHRAARSGTGGGQHASLFPVAGHGGVPT